MAIYTVGYSGCEPSDIVALMARLKVDTLVDARSIPFSRWKPAFNRRALEALLGEAYSWRGFDLGGRPPHRTTASGLAELEAADARGETRLVMCLERLPGDCHRHHAIGRPLAQRARARVVHVCADELIEAGEYERAMAEDDDGYECEPFQPWQGARARQSLSEG